MASIVIFLTKPMDNDKQKKIPESLQQLFLRLSEPSSYFAGFTQTQELPSNVVLFRRHELPGGQHSYHHRHVLVYALDIPGTVIVDGTYLRLHPGEAVLIFPHQFHHYTELAGERISWLFITFELPSATGLEVCQYLTMKVRDPGRRILYRLLKRYPNAQTTADAQEIVLLVGLFLQHLRHAAEEVPHTLSIRANPQADIVEAAGGYVYSHLAERFTVTDVADAVGCSESHLRAAFRKTVGTSFGRYLRSARLHRAQGLLLTSDSSVTEVAERCGYDSVSSFSRAFTTFTGETATTWRRRLSREPDETDSAEIESVQRRF